MNRNLLSLIFIISLLVCPDKVWTQIEKPRVIVTTDGEADDRASMVRFLLMSNELEVEAIVNSSSEFHWVGGKGWNAFHPAQWVAEYINAYAKVYENLCKHDAAYPSPDYLLSCWKVGNINAVGSYEEDTEGAIFIARILLDDADSRPIWIQAWGGCNTISAALRIIERDHPSQMKRVATKLRLFLIWEQDNSYQNYIRPHWEKYNIPTIISDQFDCMAYVWKKVLPPQVKQFFERQWFQNNILTGHGPLCDLYEDKDGAFNAEGDTPAFLHVIPNGLRSIEWPAFGGWGGRYVNVRNNVWMDPRPDSGFVYPQGQWGISSSWSKKMENDSSPAKIERRTNYFKPIWRWLDVVQNEFAARADWCVMDFNSANHPPQVILKNQQLNRKISKGNYIVLDASLSKDSDGDSLHYRWWQYVEAGTYKGEAIEETTNAKVSISIPDKATSGTTIHMICEVSDNGPCALTRYQRVILEIQ
ncbi:DUF1593 domain-containing protein [Niabella terrae]